MGTMKIERDSGVWTKLKHLIAAPPNTMAVYVLEDGTLHREPALYVGVVDAIGFYGDPRVDRRPTGREIRFEETRTHWMVLSDYNAVEAADDAANFLGVELGGVQKDWTDEIGYYLARRGQS
jgi:hypothetical protein